VDYVAAIFITYQTIKKSETIRNSRYPLCVDMAILSLGARYEPMAAEGRPEAGRGNSCSISMCKFRIGMDYGTGCAGVCMGSR
jgi:hypothetical protein